jgi:hypothetical protein
MFRFRNTITRNSCCTDMCSTTQRTCPLVESFRVKQQESLVKCHTQTQFHSKLTRFSEPNFQNNSLSIVTSYAFGDWIRFLQEHRFLLFVTVYTTALELHCLLLPNMSDMSARRLGQRGSASNSSLRRTPGKNYRREEGRWLERPDFLP